MTESAEQKPLLSSTSEISQSKPQLIEAPAAIKAWFDGEDFRRFQRRDMESSEWYALDADYSKRAAKDPEFALEYARRGTKNEEEIARLEKVVLQLRKKKEQALLEAQEEERESKIPKNLLTHYEDTLRAMGCIEGKGWISTQGREGGQSASTALKAIANARELDLLSDRAIFQIYGAGGYNRYMVFPDGAVKYSEFHGISNLERVKRLGFEIF